ncbi:MAG: HAMP domain-containing protein [Acidobacteria bacterium]|nr:HAMP domain-containing protein [Acidobacteriota bacterium]
MRTRSQTLASPLFRKILFSAFALIIATVGSADYLMTRYTGERELEQVQKNLELALRIYAGELNQLKNAELEQWARRADGQANARITVIDAGGAVLAETRHERGSMENHARRPEVSTALRGGIGIAKRHSSSLGVDFLYVAQPASTAESRSVVLRLAVPLASVNEALGEVRGRILRASLLLALLALIAAYVYTRGLTARIRAIQSYAESLANERLAEGAELNESGKDELGVLAESLRRMARQLREVVDLLKVESGRREAILASMREGVLAVDEELRVTFCNEAFLRAAGTPDAPAGPVPVVQLARTPAFLGLLRQVLTSGRTVRDKLPLAPVSGRSYEIYAEPLGIGGQKGALAILHDITELERLERVRKDFVANVSHELRTPLAAIRGYAETLLDGALEDQEYNRKFLEIIRSNAIRLTNIASDLLVVSELEQERGEQEPASEVGVHEVVEAALRTVESAARVRNIRVEIGPDSGLKVKGQRFRLEQALVNLMDNAVKFGKEGGVVRVESRQTEGGLVEVDVADDGIGIPSEDLPRIFERFYRVDKARSRAAGGTGLGLSIVKHVAEVFGGTVRVKSEVGQGSTFTLSLPAA